MTGTDYSITAERIVQMLSHGEDAKTEFKFGMPIPTFLSRDVSALANTDGGEILFGIDDTGKVVGTDIPELQRQIADTLKRVTPGVETDFAEVVVQGKSVGVRYGCEDPQLPWCPMPATLSEWGMPHAQWHRLSL